MKRILLLAIALTAITWTANAQSKSTLSLNFGASNPVGEFASKNANSETSGYAKTGIAIDLTYNYKVGKTFGFTAMLRSSANSVDKQAMAEQFAEYIPGASVIVESDAFGFGSLLIGGSASLPISEKLSFDSKAMIGYTSTIMPELKATFIGNGGSAYLMQEESTAEGVSFLIGAGLKYKASNRIALLANLDYFNTNPEFSNVKVSDSEGNSSLVTGNQPIGTINVGLGVGFMF